jgi:hypothetical protein
MARQGGLSGASANESWWLIYLYLAKNEFKVKDGVINADYWINFFENKRSVKKLLKDNGMGGLAELLKGDLDDIDDYNKFNRYDAEKFFSKGKVFDSKGKQDDGLNWDSALKFQVTKFIKNKSVNFTNTMRVLRQEEFYQKTMIKKYLGELLSGVYGFDGTLDRWNPADAWFYEDDKVIQKIKKYFGEQKVFVSQNLTKEQKKMMGVRAVVGLNKLIYKLYEEKKLLPLSLKKASFNKQSGAIQKSTKGRSTFTFNLVGVNDKKSDVTEILNPKKNQILDKRPSVRKDRTEMPVAVYSKEYVPGGTSDTTGGKKLQYVVRYYKVIYDNNGKKSYKETFAYLSSDGSNLVVSPISRFSAANSGSLGLSNLEQVIYSPEIYSKLRSIRRKILDATLSPNVLANAGKGSATINMPPYEATSITRDKTKNALKYFDALCKEIVGGLDGKEIKMSKRNDIHNKIMNGQGSYKNTAKEIQNVLELTYAIENSKNTDSLIIDLWKFATGQGSITNTEIIDKKVFEMEVRKNMQEGMNRNTAEEAAEQFLRAKPPTRFKIPSSFHIKLY